MSVSNLDENTLDIYFNNLFHAQVEFSVNDDEVHMIKTGIEWMVTTIVQEIEKETMQVRKELSGKFLDRYPGHELICGGNSSGGNIVKAGSFYEGTKNGYPDEFDFIYIISTFEAIEIRETDETYWRQKYFILSEFHDVIRDIVSTLLIPNFYFTSKDGPFLRLSGYDRHEGPASKFKFAYWNEFYDIKYLYVDIVPAFKIIDHKIHLRMRDACFVKEFVREVKATGSYLITEEVSFTATELFFIRTILSDRHHMAYRLVKYLFNGNRNGNVLSSHTHLTAITSYVIKVAMINHHSICKNPTVKVSNCVISVIGLLQQLCTQYPYNSEVVVFRKLNGCLFNFRFNDINMMTNLIRKLLMKLELMKVLDLPLNIKPMSKLIVSDIETRHSTGANKSMRSQTSTNNTFKSRKSARMSLQNSTSPSPAVEASSNRSSIFNWEDDLTSIAFRVLVSDRDVISLPASFRRLNMPKAVSHSTPKNSVLNTFFFQKPDSDEFSISSSEEHVGSSILYYDTLSPVIIPAPVYHTNDYNGLRYYYETLPSERFPTPVFEKIEEGISTKPNSKNCCCLIM